MNSTVTKEKKISSQKELLTIIIPTKNRPYLLNREPLSAHLKMMRDAGFKIRCKIVKESQSNIQRQELPHRFRNISNDDLTTSSAFIQASKI